MLPLILRLRNKPRVASLSNSTQVGDAMGRKVADPALRNFRRPQ